MFQNYFAFTAGRRTAISVLTPSLKINKISISQKGNTVVLRTNSISQKWNRTFKKFTKSRKSRPSPHRQICPGKHENPGSPPIGIYCEIDFLDFTMRSHCGESKKYSHRWAQTTVINFLVNEIYIKQKISFT